MDKAIVITTINPPREEIHKFSNIPGWKLVCVGDLKTPKNWDVKNVDYVSPKMQEKLFPKFSKIFPWNMYARKDFGYLYAIKNGAKVVCDTDDDVFPYENFPLEIKENKKAHILNGKKFINIYKYFLKKTHKDLIWARGFPLEFIRDQEGIKGKDGNVYAPIQNSVIDQNSDFDAIYRFVFDKWVDLKKSGEFALEKGCYAPVNSQNTFTFKEAFPLLYLPVTAGFRMEDISRGYIAQRILWEIGAKMLFTYPTAYTSNRNAHNYLNDFKLEIPVFTKTKLLVDILDSLSLDKDITKSLIKVYKELVKREFFPKEELIFVTAWVQEMENII
jgi:hypothetical protein